MKKEKNYLAKIFYDKNVVQERYGDNPEELECWAHAQVIDSYGNFSAMVLENHSQEVVARFCHSPPE